MYNAFNTKKTIRSFKQIHVVDKTVSTQGPFSSCCGHFDHITWSLSTGSLPSSHGNVDVQLFIFTEQFTLTTLPCFKLHLLMKACNTKRMCMTESSTTLNGPWGEIFFFCQLPFPSKAINSETQNQKFTKLESRQLEITREKEKERKTKEQLMWNQKYESFQHSSIPPLIPIRPLSCRCGAGSCFSCEISLWLTRHVSFSCRHKWVWRHQWQGALVWEWAVHQHRRVLQVHLFARLRCLCQAAQMHPNDPGVWA